MKTYKKVNIEKKFKKSVLAIGNFDGLHLGHQKVLRQARKKAEKHKLKFGVMTFEPVPVMFFNKKIKHHRINNLKQKIIGFKKIKVDFLIIIKFNKKFSNLSSNKFIEKILYKNLNIKYLFVSKNFKFGKNREGNVEKLKANEKKYNFKTIISEPLKKNRKVISSTMIRKLLLKGKITKANSILGRSWSIEGKVIKGKQRGRKIGFPTCNIKIDSYIKPKLGVYSVEVETNSFKRKGIANLGYRPTFNGQNLLLEVNIFGIKFNLYKKIIRVKFIKFIRNEKKFRSIIELKEQIKQDIKKV